jgi:23S rRNA pseudouridine2605 synthase
MKHPPLRFATDRIRINRYLSMCGFASRRKAEDLVAKGKVEVNGKVISDLGTKIDPHRDKVFVDGTHVVQLDERMYLVMNKPKDTITTLSDERGRPTVMNLLRMKHRVFPIGRLDRNTTGVLLFTNDGDFANRLMHPKYEIPKVYRVTCDRPVEHDDIRQLRNGIRLEEGTARAEITVLPSGKRKELGVLIREGRNRQVHRMFQTLGYKVTKLDRVAYGPITRGGLSRGAWRPLTKAEIQELKRLGGIGERG